MISAGVNWYMARAECEFVLDDTSEVILYSKSMAGEEALPYGAAAGPSRPAEPGDEAASWIFPSLGKGNVASG